MIALLIPLQLVSGVEKSRVVISGACGVMGASVIAFAELVKTNVLSAFSFLNQMNGWILAGIAVVVTVLLILLSYEIISIPSPVRNSLIFYIYMIWCNSKNIFKNVTYLASQFRKGRWVLTSVNADLDHSYRLGIASSEVELVVRFKADHEPAF